VYQKNLDKIKEITPFSAMGVSGPNCDMVRFTEYIDKNFALYQLRNHGTQLNTAAQANFCRNQLAQALRKGPFQVNVLLGGYDAKAEEGSLYFMDYIGALQKVPYGAQGYAQYFCMSTMDREFTPNMDQQAALNMVQKCIHELRTRFLLAQDNFIIKIIDENGVQVHSFDEDPANT